MTQQLSTNVKTLTIIAPTGDGAVRERLADMDLSTVATAQQQAHSIGISPATAPKLNALLQWTLRKHAMAKDKHTRDPSHGHSTELRACRRRALIARDVAQGRQPLAVLEWYRVPLCDGTERLFTSDEVIQAQSHFDAKVTDGLQGFADERTEPPDLSLVDSNITPQQAQRIGNTMGTAAKFSAFINDAAEQHTAATVVSRTDPIGAIPQLNRSLRLHTAGMQVACGHVPLATLASYRMPKEHGALLFSSSEIGRARARGDIHRPASPLDGPPRLPTKRPRPRHSEQADTTPFHNGQSARFVGERQERERARASITTEGAEAIHHFICESLLCAVHAQNEYHRLPCEATATAMDEARAMASDGINVLSGIAAPEALIQYVRDDAGIYGRPGGSERAFTHEMLNLPPLDPPE